MSLAENLRIDKKLKEKLKRIFPQPKGNLPVNSLASDLDREQQVELHRLPTEISSKYNPKTMALIKELSKDAEPE